MHREVDLIFVVHFKFSLCSVKVFTPAVFYQQISQLYFLLNTLNAYSVKSFNIDFAHNITYDYIMNMLLFGSGFFESIK